ncbi:hypothetical protein D3C81_2094600 [compost metagenome]
MPAYQAPSRDLSFATHAPFDLENPQGSESVAAETLDTIVENDATFYITHAWGLYPA